MQIYVGNLSFNITEDELQEVFAEYGEVSSVTKTTAVRLADALGIELSQLYE